MGMWEKLGFIEKKLSTSKKEISTSGVIQNETLTCG